MIVSIKRLFNSFGGDGEGINDGIFIEGEIWISVRSNMYE